MDAPLAVIPPWLDAAAIAVGAAAAAIVAEQFRSKRLDWLGVVIISTAAALGGGIVRDLLIGVRPVAMTNEWYLLTAALAGLGGMLLQSLLAKRNTLVMLFDALALGFFCAVGTAKAVEAGLPILPSIFIGTCTAAGGGMIRDVLVGMPVGVLYAGSFYAFAAMGGASVYVAAESFGMDPIWAMVVCAAVTFAVRMASVWFGLSLPEQIALQWPARFRRRGSAAGIGPDPALAGAGAIAEDGSIERPLTDAEFVDAAGFHAPDTRPIDLVQLAAEAQARARAEAEAAGGAGAGAAPEAGSARQPD